MQRLTRTISTLLFLTLIAPASAFALNCDFSLSGFIVKNFHHKTIKEIFTPFEDSSDRVKIIIKAVEESYLNYGRGDNLSAKSLGRIFTSHFDEVYAAEKDLDQLIHKIKFQNERRAAKAYVTKLATDLRYFQNLKYLPPREFQQWSIRAAAFYGFLRTAKNNPQGPLRFENIDHASKTLEFYPGQNLSALPIVLSADPLRPNDFSWQEMNDLWILNIAIIGLTRIDRAADGEIYEPLFFSVHDFSHAKDLGEKYEKLSTTQLLKLLKNNLNVYKRFRKLQDEEQDPRKKQIREAIAFTLLHEASTQLSMVSLAERIDYHTSTIQIKFLEPFGFNEGFQPSVSRDEVINELKWLKTNWR